MDFQENTYIVIVVSNSQAISLYKELKDMNIMVDIMAAPCRLSSSCSKCIKFDGVYFDLVLEKIKEENIKINGIYKLTRKSNNKANYKLIRK